MRPCPSTISIVPLRAPLGVAGLLVGLAVAACCTTGANTPAPMPTLEDPEPVASPPADEPAPGAAADASCLQPPTRACCMAMIPSCIACQEGAQAEHDAWAARCGAAPTDASLQPEAFDCDAPPVLPPCCRAKLPQCYACVERNNELAAAWQAACRP